MGEITARFLAKKAYKIICGNNYLAEWFRRYNNNVYVIPTAVDVHKFIPRCNKRKDIVLGWIGTHGNLKYLEKIYPTLLKILNSNRNVYLNIVSDKRPEFCIDNSRANYIEWSAEDEVQNFQSIDIGLMPLDDNPEEAERKRDVKKNKKKWDCQGKRLDSLIRLVYIYRRCGPTVHILQVILRLQRFIRYLHLEK